MDRFRNHTPAEKAADIALLKEMVSRPGVIPPLLAGDIDDLLEMLPTDFFVRIRKLQLRNLINRKSSVLTEVGTNAARKLAEKSLPVCDEDLADLDLLRYLNPALWYRMVLEMRKISPVDSDAVIGQTGGQFRGGSVKRGRR